jgi:hypothetical protein
MISCFCLGFPIFIGSVSSHSMIIDQGFLHLHTSQLPTTAVHFLYIPSILTTVILVFPFHVLNFIPHFHCPPFHRLTCVRSLQLTSFKTQTLLPHYKSLYPLCLGLLLRFPVGAHCSVHVFALFPQIGSSNFLFSARYLLLYRFLHHFPYFIRTDMLSMGRHDVRLSIRVSCSKF